MPAKVTLTKTQAGGRQEQFVFDDRTTCIIGRASDCRPRLPDDPDHKTVSRHHCLLDINPPDIRVRDFGSKNGTYVNGRKIGQRLTDQTPREAARHEFPEYDLQHGDEIKLGKTVFRVGITAPLLCSDCAVEIPVGQEETNGQTPGSFRCKSCHETAAQSRRPETSQRKSPACAKCGGDISREVDENRRGDYICTACRADPRGIVQRLLGRAKGGQSDLLAIRGYTVDKELGRGGMGAVYLAHRCGTDEPVALKVMLPAVAADQRARQMFLREAENAKALRHPNVVHMQDSGCCEGTFFLTLEYCDGGSVAELVERRGSLPADEALRIVLQTLDGLDYAHHAPVPQVKLEDGRIGRGRGLVHRDLSPDNVFLVHRGQATVAKIGDYGLSKAFDNAGLSGQTRTGAMMGKPWFMPRQQVIDFKYSRPAVDVWAAAATLYYMLCGQFPRNFPQHLDPWHVVLQTQPIPVRRRNDSVPIALAEVIDQALADEPELAFETATELKRALELACSPGAGSRNRYNQTL